MTLEVIVVPVADVGGEGLLCQTTASAKHGKLRPSASRARIPMKASA
jgi:hypothetical protein